MNVNLRSALERHVCRRAFLGTVALAAMSGVAEAYLLPSAFVLKKASTHLKKYPGVQVTLTGKAVVGGQVIAVGERWLFDQSRRGCRVDVNGSGGLKASWAWQEGQPIAGATEGDARLLPTAVERVTLSHLLALADLRALTEALSIDAEVYRLGLLGDRVAYVIGAESNEPDAPQLWIDQERFTVSRVRYRGTDGRIVQLELQSWWGPPAPGAFPARLRVQVGRALTRQVDLDRIRISAAQRGGGR